jgi:hypothetical protein
MSADQQQAATQQTELSPCPFCGEIPQVDMTEDHSDNQRDTWLVCCGSPFCYGNAFTLDNSYLTKAHACEAWNTRADGTVALRAERDALVKERDEAVGVEQATEIQLSDAQVHIEKLRARVLACGPCNDHACAECFPGGDVLVPGFKCAYHTALELDIAPVSDAARTPPVAALELPEGTR